MSRDATSLPCRLLAAFLFTVLPAMAIAKDDAKDVDPEPLLKIICAVQPKGEAHRAAIEATQKLSAASPDQLPAILAGLDGADPLAANWIRGVVDAIAERALAEGTELPKQELEAFVVDRTHAPRGRRLAYELLSRVDDTAEERLIPGMLDDPSLELRRDAVAKVLAAAEAAVKEDGGKERGLKLYTGALSAARDLDQIEAASKRLGELGQPVDLPRHFGFLMHWNLIGPFDNTGGKGYAVAYQPEADVDLAAAYQGKTEQIQWKPHETVDRYGMVDLNKAIGKNMGAVAYATAEFVLPEARDVELRLGTINASKMWLNGQQLHERESYHANTGIDQYIARGSMKAGKNVILLKICQNEQTDSWAQDWQFQLRVCDAAGTAILSEDRPASPPAVLATPPAEAK